MPKLLLATGNRAKLYELRSLFQALPYELVTPSEMGISAKVDEVGQSLEENARLKAITFAASSQLLTLADDSGLEVDALGGEPGVLSARYAGADASDTDRIDYLLLRIKDVPWQKRQARFRCVMAIATPDGQVSLFCGDCPGVITLEPRGEMGFGYDPIFYLPRLGKTLAELPLEVKNRVSHRGQAARKAFPLLKRLIDSKNIQ
jgi:XTP/dITP diphosphohydrolase